MAVLLFVFGVKHQIEDELHVAPKDIPSPSSWRGDAVGHGGACDPVLREPLR
jgi:hypothetical protein